MTVVMTKDEPVEQKKVGLTDWIQHQLNCEYCNAPLMIVAVVRPEFKFKDGTPYRFKYKATCPYCKGSSSIKEIQGEVRFLNIAETTNGIEKNITTFGDIDTDMAEGLCTIEVLKNERKSKTDNNLGKVVGVQFSSNPVNSEIQNS